MNHPFHCRHFQYCVDCNVHQLKRQNQFSTLNLCIWIGTFFRRENPFRRGWFTYLRTKMASLQHHGVMWFPIQLYLPQLLLEYWHCSMGSFVTFNYLNDKKLPVVIVGGAVSTRSLPYVVFSCVEKNRIEVIRIQNSDWNVFNNINWSLDFRKWLMWNQWKGHRFV